MKNNSCLKLNLHFLFQRFGIIYFVVDNYWFFVLVMIFSKMSLIVLYFSIFFKNDFIMLSSDFTNKRKRLFEFI